MKEVSIIAILVFCFICCKSDKEMSNIDTFSKTNEKYNPKQFEPKNPIIKNQRIALSDILNYKLLWNLPLTEHDELGEPNYIKLKSNRFDYYEKNYLVGTYYSGYPKNKILAIDENTVVMPIRFTRSCKFSYWNFENDSLIFIKFLEPSIGGTYQMPYLDTLCSIDNRNLIIGTTKGGEGDDVWEELWIKRILENDSLVTLEHVEYSYTGSMKEQSYLQEIIGNKLKRSVYIDSVNGQKDTMVSIVELNSL